MKKRLLLMTLATTMALSMFTGCGSNKEKEDDTTPTSVEQNDNNDVENSTKEESTSKEEAKAYEETYDVELDMEEIEENYNKDLEKLNETYAENNKKNAILTHDVTKYVFEDMTKKFKNKEEVSVTSKITITEFDGYASTTLVCDLKNMVPEDSVYTEFGGFYVDESKAVTKKKTDGELDCIKVVLGANKIQEEEGGRFKTPMYVTVTVDVNEDGTYSYRELYIQYYL